MPHVFRGASSAQSQLKKTAIAIGNFDGVHVGHRALLAQAISLAKKDSCSSCVLTFDPHPARYFKPELAPPLITTEAQKIRLLGEQGIDAVVIEPFTKELAAMAPEEFVRRILGDSLHAKHVVVGYDFAFGRRRSGTSQTLSDRGAENGIQVHIVAPVSADDLVVSSTKIREFVLMGRMRGAALLLGRNYEISGVVGSGFGRGQKMGIPTANITTENELIPGRGVYGGMARIGDMKQPIKAVINIGHAPTFGGTPTARIEAHLLDFNEDIVNKPIAISFIERLRDERRFDSVDALAEQIRADIAAMRALVP